MMDAPQTLEQVAQLQAQLVAVIPDGAAKLKSVLPADVLVNILKATESILRTEPSLVELSIEDPQTQVFVFGDTHGHFPDVSYMLNQLGLPSESRTFVFNGDYVDRGSWGVELLTLLCSLKCAAPKLVYLLRGNHESSTCTKYYGFYEEVRAKYGKQAKDVYSASKRLFSTLPLAALIQKNTLVMHGGLFRRPPEPKRVKRRKSNHPGRAGAASSQRLVPGSLDDLRRANKGGMDPDGCGASLLATDVLWSDPVAKPGFEENSARGVGLAFGPDITEAFLTANQLRLIIRSHEGPDARDKRTDLPQVLQGYSFDHDTPAGQLVTVFSAPDYPQFQCLVPEEDGTAGKRYENLAAVAVLSAPDYSTPAMRTFAAVKPRPKADAYYDFSAYGDSDTELPEETDGGSQAASGAASEGDLGGEEVEGPSGLQTQSQSQATNCSDIEKGEEEGEGGSLAVEAVCQEQVSGQPTAAAEEEAGGPCGSPAMETEQAGGSRDMVAPDAEQADGAEAGALGESADAEAVADAVPHPAEEDLLLAAVPDTIPVGSGNEVQPAQGMELELVAEDSLHYSPNADLQALVVSVAPGDSAAKGKERHGGLLCARGTGRPC